MKFLLSLDYELFFGHRTGSVGRCVIEPTDALLRAVSRYGLRLTFFVDAAYLVRLAEEAKRNPSLRQDCDAIRTHLERLGSDGHDIQLHIHPHWVDSHFDDGRWVLETSRYQLHDFPAGEQEYIVKSSKALLEEISQRPVFAFRAGGWCLQPFPAISGSLRKSGVWLESTVFPGGLSEDPDRSFDFRTTPGEALWRFSDDPTVADEKGWFLEIPISSFRSSPLLFWRMALAKRLARGRHRAFGDGSAISYGAAYYLSRLVLPSTSVASIDGMKADALRGAYRAWLRSGRSGLFHALGHPKALTLFSFEMLVKFLEETKNLESVTLADFAHLKPAN